MNSRAVSIVAILGLSLSLGCFRSEHVTGRMDIQWESDGRSYQAIVFNESDQPVVEVRCRYLGKKPEEPIAKPISRDWMQSDTDFYHYELINTSAAAVELLDVSYRLKYGKSGKVYETRGQSRIEDELGGFVIDIGSKLTRRNSWVFGNGKENVMHKIYRAKTEGGVFYIDIHLVYER